MDCAALTSAGSAAHTGTACPPWGRGVDRKHLRRCVRFASEGVGMNHRSAATCMAVLALATSLFTSACTAVTSGGGAGTAISSRSGASPSASKALSPSHATSGATSQSSATSSVVPAPISSAASPPPTWAQTFATLSTGVVRIDDICDSGGREMTGTGFLIAPDLVATVAHVVEGDGSLRVTSPSAGIATAAQIVGFSHARRPCSFADGNSATGTPLSLGSFGSCNRYPLWPHLGFRSLVRCNFRLVTSPVLTITAKWAGSSTSATSYSATRRSTPGTAAGLGSRLTDR